MDELALATNTDAVEFLLKYLTHKGDLSVVKTVAEKANKKSRLPEEINMKRFLKLKILKNINYNYWRHEGFIPRHLNERKIYKLN